MTKRKTVLLGALCALSCAFAAFAFASCAAPAEQGGSTSTTSTTSSTPSEELLSVTGVSFGDDSAVYDGERHEIVVSGELPAGDSVG